MKESYTFGPCCFTAGCLIKGKCKGFNNCSLPTTKR